MTDDKDNLTTITVFQQPSEKDPTSPSAVLMLVKDVGEKLLCWSKFFTNILPTSLQPFHPTSLSTAFDIAENAAQWWSQIDLIPSETAVDTTAVAITAFPTTSQIIFTTTSTNTKVLTNANSCNLVQKVIANKNVTIGITCVGITFRKG